MQPVANLMRSKFVVAGVGVGLGVATSVGLEHALPSHATANRLEARGEGSMLNSSQARVYAMAGTFAFGGGISLGLAKHGGTAGFTTATFLAGNALLSTVAGAAVNADSSKADNYLASVGVMAALVGSGALLGVRDELTGKPVRQLGLAMLGVAAGVTLPTVAGAIGAFPDRVGNGFAHRPGADD